MAGMYCMRDLLELLLREGGEELHLLVDRPPTMIVRGEPLTIHVAALTTDQVAGLLESIASESEMRELRECGDIHFIYLFQNSARFAVTATLGREALNVNIKNLAR